MPLQRWLCQDIPEKEEGDWEKIATMKIGITEYFDSMHYLPGHPKCGNPHGHTYQVDIAVEGKLLNGMIMDFGLLREKVREVLTPFDHATLNDIVPYPSCENLCQ